MIKVYIIKGTLEEQQQAKTTTTQLTGIPTTSTFTPSALPQPTITQQLHIQPTDEENHPIAATGYSKEIANTAKIYIEEQKYNSTNKSLNYKLTIFYNIYN